MTLVYSFFFMGVILTALAAVMGYYARIFTNSERLEGRVTKLREMDKYGMQICPEIEYSLYGELKNAHHCTGVLKGNINFSVGDTIAVLINPDHPNVFRLENEKTATKKHIYIIAAIGISFIIAGFIKWRFFT